MRLVPKQGYLRQGSLLPAVFEHLSNIVAKPFGKPTETLPIVAFEASKIDKTTAIKDEPKEIEGNREQMSSPPHVQGRSPALASPSGWSD